MLAQIAIAATTRGVFNQESLVVLLHNDIHHTRYRIRAVEGTRRSLHNLDLLDVLGVDEREVVLTTHITMNALTVDQHKDVVITQSVELHLRAHIVLAESERGRQT